MLSPEQRALLTLVEGSPDGIERLDRDGRRLYANATFAAMLGLSPDAILGRTSRELGIPEPLANNWEAHARSVFESGRTLEAVNAFPAPDGIRFLESRFLSEQSADGTVAAVVAVHRDITDRKRSEEALRQSEERLRFAQQAAGIGAFDWNIQTGINTWTPEMEAIYGLPPGSFPGKRDAWEKMVHPDDREALLERLEQSFVTGTPEQAEWRIVRPDGIVRWLAGRWKVFRDDAGEPLRVMGINIDITQRKQLDEALRHSEECFRLAIKATNDAIWDFDLITGKITWNETYATLYGRPADTSNSWQWWI
jgi:PAS domain S-box-containing protein